MADMIIATQIFCKLKLITSVTENPV